MTLYHKGTKWRRGACQNSRFVGCQSRMVVAGERGRQWPFLISLPCTIVRFSSGNFLCVDGKQSKAKKTKIVDVEFSSVPSAVFLGAKVLFQDTGIEANLDRKG